MHTIAELSAADHPDAKRLRAFSEGELPLAELEQIGIHLANCDQCLSFLDGYSPGRRHSGPIERALPPAASQESSASALLDDTTVGRIKAAPDFMRMTALAKALLPASSSVTANWTGQPTDEAPIPEKIGHYFVLGQLGQGGFATVYLAKDPEHNRQVAVKVPRRDKMWGETAVAGFLREA